MIVYRLTSPVGKCYIGVAKNLEDRFHVHKTSPYAVGQMIRKYGEENIQKETLLVGEPDYCYMIEARLIESLGTVSPRGYNLTAGGKGVRGHAPEVLERMGVAISAALRRPATRAKISQNATRQWSDPGMVERCRASNVETWADPALRERHGETMREINLRPEIREATSERTKKQHQDPAFREKLRAAVIASNKRRAK